MVDVAPVLRSCRGALSSRARQLTKPLSADLRFLAGFRDIVSDLSAIRRLFRNGVRGDRSANTIRCRPHFLRRDSWLVSADSCLPVGPFEEGQSNLMRFDLFFIC